MGQIVQQGKDTAAETLAPSRRVRQVLGTMRLANLCGLGESAVRKWDRPKSRGGTGGLLPAQFQARILKVIKEENLPLTAEDLIAEPQP